MRDTRSVKSILLEVFSIVLGVLLALAVSEWQEEREKAELAQLALVNIEQELGANLSLLTKIHTNNAETIAQAEAARSADDSEAVEESRQFIPGVQVRATAWQAMLSSGISTYVDYDLLLTLSELYSMQSIYRETGMQLVDTSMSMSAMATVNRTDIDNRVFQQQFSSYFSMMLQMEETLLTESAVVLERLGTSRGDRK